MGATVIIYDEGTEWSFSSNSGGRVVSAPGSPHTGANSIQGTNVGSGDNAVLTAPATLLVGSYALLSLWLEPIGANWTNALSDFSFNWQDAAGNLVGIGISAKAAAYGFSPSNNTYQNLLIPIGDFQIPAGSAVQKLVATALPKTSFSFLLDTIALFPAMAVSCDPATIVAAAKCFSCVPPQMRKPVELYLLATIGGLATNQAGVASIVQNAAQFRSIPDEMWKAVEAYLLAQLAGCQ